MSREKFNKSLTFQLRKTVSNKIVMAAIVDKSTKKQKYYIFRKSHRDLKNHPIEVQLCAAREAKKTNFKSQCSFDVKFKSSKTYQIYVDLKTSKYWFDKTYLEQRVNLRKQLSDESVQNIKIDNESELSDLSEHENPGSHLINTTKLQEKLKKELGFFDYLIHEPEDYLDKYESFLSLTCESNQLVKLLIYVLSDSEAEIWYFNETRNKQNKQWSELRKNFIKHFMKMKRQTFKYVFQEKPKIGDDLVNFFHTKFEILKKLYPQLEEKQMIKMVLINVNDEIAEKLYTGAE